MRGYPALLDDGDSVSIRVFTTSELQAKVMRNGVRRLMLLATPVSKRAIERDVTNADRLAVARYRRDLDRATDRRLPDCRRRSRDHGFRRAAVHRDSLRRAGGAGTRTTCRSCGDCAARRVRRHRRRERRQRAPRSTGGAHRCRQAPTTRASSSVDSCALASSLPSGVARLGDLLRYVKGIDHRLNKLPENPTRDATTLRSIAALERRYVALLRRLDHDEITPDVIELGWLFEELRISLFAQQLGTARSVSIQRVTKELDSPGG